MSGNHVPDGLMERLTFVDEPVPEEQVPPRIDPDTPLVFSPGDF